MEYQVKILQEDDSILFKNFDTLRGAVKCFDESVKKVWINGEEFKFKNMAVKTYKQLERNEDKTFGITAKYEINSNNNLSPDTKKVVQFFKPLKNDWNIKGSKISLYAPVWFEIEDKEPIIIKGKKTYLHLQEIKDGELIKNLNSKVKSFVTGYEENKPKKISILQQALFWLSKYQPKFPIFSPELRKKSNNS